MTFDVNHIGMQPGLYLSKVESDLPQGKGIVTYDLRLVEPYGGKLITIEELHTLEHVLSVALRSTNLEQLKGVKVIYEGAMACQTGMYLVLYGDLQDITDSDIISQWLLASIREAFCMREVPAKQKERCGNMYTLLSVKDVHIWLDKIFRIADEVKTQGRFDKYNYID